MTADERVLCLAFTHREARLALRERLAARSESLPALLREAAGLFGSCVILDRPGRHFAIPADRIQDTGITHPPRRSRG